MVQGYSFTRVYLIAVVGIENALFVLIQSFVVRLFYLGLILHHFQVENIGPTAATRVSESKYVTGFTVFILMHECPL